MAWLQWSLDPSNRAKAEEVLARDAERRQRERERKERSGQLEEIRERCKTLPGFVREGWHVLEPETEFVWGWALDAIAEFLQAIADGEIIRGLINIPPGMMKSLMSGVFFPAYGWGPLERPGLRILGTSFKEEHAARDTGKMKALVTSDWFTDLYPHVKVIGKGAEDHFQNNRTGWRKGRPMQSLTGDRGDWVIVDDPHSIEGGESKVSREKTVRVMRETIPTRLNNPKKSAILVIMQRVHEEDVSGMILSERLGYSHLMMPMRFEPDRRCIVYKKDGTELLRDRRVYDGELLFQERFDRESVDRTEGEMTAYAVAGQMQQRPTPREGGLFKRDWFEIVDAFPMGGRDARSWDLAGTKKKQASQDPDWTAGLKGKRTSDGTFWITDLVHLRDTPGKIASTIKNTASQDGFGTVITIPQDPGQAAKFQIEFLVSLLAAYTVKSEIVSGDKEVRAGPAASQAEFGKIKLVRGPWNKAFLDEVCNFPGAKHDDIVDALSDLIRVLSSLTIYDLSGVS